MNRFVVIVTATGHLRPTTESYLADPAPDQLAFRPIRHVRWASTDGSVHYAGWEEGGEARAAQILDGFISYAGSPRPRRGAWSKPKPILEHLAEAAAFPDWSPTENLCDAYAIVRVEASGHGYIAMDPLGLQSLYTAVTATATIIGNRADLVAHVAAKETGTTVTKSLPAGAWMAFAGHHVDDMTGFAGVRTLSHDSAIDVGNRRATVVSGAAAFDTAEHGTDTPAVEVAHQLAEQTANGLLHMIERSDHKPDVELTGGKDSRVLVAAALGAQLTDAVRFVTYGAASLPDMQVARMIAEQFGLDHIDASHTHYLGAAHFTPVQRYRRHAHRTCGASQSGDSNEPAAQPAWVGSGHIGELYRGPPPRPDEAALTWGRATKAFLRRRQFGTAQLLRPAVHAELLDQLIEYFDAPRPRVRSPAELEPAFIMRCRYARWQGPLVDLHAKRVLPMYSPAVVEQACLMSRHDHALEQVHHQVVSQASPVLAEMPFANDRWRGPDMASPDPVTGPKSAKQQNRSAGAARAANSHSSAAIREIIEGSPDNPMWEVLDPARTHSALDRVDNLKSREKHQLLGAVSAMIWLADDETPSPPDWREERL